MRRLVASALLGGCLATGALLACAGSPPSAPPPTVVVAPAAPSSTMGAADRAVIAAQLTARTDACEKARADEDAGDRDATVPIPDADRVIADLRVPFRQCYLEGLKTDRTMQGRVIISAHVTAEGRVDSTRATSRDGLSATVETCLAEVLSHATFSPPGGCGTLLQVPVRFVLADK